MNSKNVANVLKIHRKNKLIFFKNKINTLRCGWCKNKCVEGMEDGPLYEQCKPYDWNYE